jgi:hypothetical protein
MGKLHGPVWPPLPRPNFTALIMAEHTSVTAEAKPREARSARRRAIEGSRHVKHGVGTHVEEA